MLHDHDRLCIELGRLEWARQLKAEAVQDIASAAELMEFHAGRIVIERESEVNHAYFVIIGRLEGVLFDRLGKEILRDFFGADRWPDCSPPCWPIDPIFKSRPLSLHPSFACRWTNCFA